MELESYFDFVSDTEIRIKGTRVYVQYILRPFLQGVSVEELIDQFRTVSQEKLFATLTYYYANEDKMNEYLAKADAYEDSQYERYLTENAERIKMLRERFAKYRAERNAKAG
jgi:uncharacterized protein (DUF433 family)